MVIDTAHWRGRDVLVTGHTGFKGAWLCQWLQRLGARVHGYALAPPTEPNLFDACALGEWLATDTRADLADGTALVACMAQTRPSLVFHLAAQSLVRESYAAPLQTFATNVMGTAQLLQAAREVGGVRAIVIATTDKVYENHGSGNAFRETDALGGDDPYSASKAACEIVAASFRSSFFRAPDAPRLATARAGNVIGGGDWASDRLVPDCLRAFAAGAPVYLRYPHAVRPWQHVLEPLSGYLLLAQALLGEDGLRYARAWNFGPTAADDAPVQTVAEQLAQLWGGAATVRIDDTVEHLPEAVLLRLDSSQAAHELGWRPRWNLSQALQATVEWQRAWLGAADLHALVGEQIARHGGVAA